ncbi:hypothetical protein [Octadecabacter antarcticus]|uniref:hypothetical protein n=1 Tax=Octadecabacter antarcticus TaxID=1217908 RepID=UPI001FE1B9F4|nr:hypothetical protein [Octadecabacter antarcticus]
MGRAQFGDDVQLYAFGFVAFLFPALPVETASPLIRKAFPHFYTFVFVTATVAALAAFSGDPTSGAALLFIAISTVLRAKY